MNIAVIGTGYVGLVTGACFAESGNNVVGIDKDESKIKILDEDRLPIYEPGLLDLVRRNRREGRLKFTTNLPAGIQAADLVFIAVGTPQGSDGMADLSNVWAVGEAVARALQGPKVVVIKSTVPVGTNRQLAERMRPLTTQPFDVASNPEFLKEGTAVEDCMKPDRVVVGVRRPEVAETLRQLYSPYLRTDHPFLVMTPESAEMTKYAANAMLATKISFINEIANLCERMEADINDVRRGIGHDARIGFQFLFPGAGWGGSCFPKDVQALIAMSHRMERPARLLEAVHYVNERQKQTLPAKIRNHYGSALREKTLGVWGLSFKPRTDDIREAPSLSLIDAMLSEGVKLRVHDPEALGNMKKLYGEKLTYCEHPYDAVDGADGLVVVTEWQEFRQPDFPRLKKLLREPVVFDGRNLYEPHVMKEKGFVYYSIGRNVL